MKSRFFALTFTLCLAAAVSAASTVFFFAPDREAGGYDLDKTAPLSELYFEPYQDTPYSDSLYYQFEVAEGVDFFCHFFYADMGFRVKKYGMDYKLTKKGGEKVYFGRKFDSDEGSMAKNAFAWKLGPNSAGGDADSQRLRIQSGPLSVDVTLKVEVPYYQVGEQGALYLDEDREEWSKFVYFPLFSVTGKIKEGATVHKVDGWGYGNRVYAENYMITDFSRLHTALRWQKDGLGFDLHDYYAIEEYGSEWLPVLMVYRDGKMIHVSQSFEKEVLEHVVEPKSGKKLPASYRVASRAEDVMVTIEFTDVKLTDYNDPLIVLSSFEKTLIQLISDAPLDLRFDGRVKMTLTTPEGTVVKEGPGHGLALVSL